MGYKIAFEYKVDKEKGKWYVFRKRGRTGSWEINSDAKENKNQAMKEMHRQTALFPVSKAK